MSDAACACDEPGPGNAVACHVAYYGVTETARLTSTSVVPTDRCHCGCHRDEAGAESLDGRPRFSCSKCADTWTCGFDGGEWAALTPAERPTP